MPSRIVDDAWHTFILFTKEYEAFCRRAFKRFFHHIPDEAGTSAAEARTGMNLAWNLACRGERIDPRNPRRLPDIFGIDESLGVRGGTRYSLDPRPADRGGKPGELPVYVRDYEYIPLIYTAGILAGTPGSGLHYMEGGFADVLHPPGGLFGGDGGGFDGGGAGCGGGCGGSA